MKLEIKKDQQEGFNNYLISYIDILVKGYDTWHYFKLNGLNSELFLIEFRKLISKYEKRKLI